MGPDVMEDGSSNNLVSSERETDEGAATPLGSSSTDDTLYLNDDFIVNYPAVSGDAEQLSIHSAGKWNLYSYSIS